MALLDIFSCKIRGFSYIVLIIPGLMLGGSGCQARSDNLTTFEEYAKMTPKQQSDVRSNAGGKIFEQAIRQNNRKRLKCLDQTYLTKYGDPKDVEIAHARLRGIIEAAVMHPDPNGRVEYLIENHMKEVCPKSGDTVQR